jgi:hypothetical protein
MKKLIVPLAFLLLAACGQKAPKAQDDAQEEKLKGPVAQIEFPEGTDHDFGIYYEKEDKTHDFLVRNPGKVPLVINQIETSCGCTTAIGPEKPILEGKTDTIHVIYDGNGFTEGNWIKLVRIYANIEEPYIDLTLKGAYFNRQ